ncbi:MAG: hypothetical protein AAF585_15730 [Verrucomicrobiota bacterium]
MKSIFTIISLLGGLSSSAFAYDLTILVEFISAERTDAVRLVTEHADQADGTQLRAAVQKLIDKKEAEWIDASLVRGRNGLRAKIEGIEEFPYPSEFDPPESAKNLDLENVDTEAFKTSQANPGAYEIRNLGATLEVDPRISSDGETINLDLNPEFVSLNRFRFYEREEARESSPIANVKMPIFHTIRPSTSLQVRDGKYGLVALASHPSEKGQMVFIFVRVDLLKK